MKESTKVVLVMTVITGAFLIAGNGDFEEAAAQEQRAKARMEKCMPRPGEVLTAEWVKGELVCQTHVGRYGAVPRITGCQMVM